MEIKFRGGKPGAVLTVPRTTGAPRLASFLMLFLVLTYSTGCLMDVGLFSGPAEEGQFDKTLKVDLPLKLVVKTGSGNIRLYPGSSAELKVHAQVKVRGLNQKDAADILQAIIKDPPVEVSGNEVRLGSLDKYGLSRKSVSINFDIQAPEQTEVESRSGSGNQDIAGVQGPVTATCGSGNVLLRDVKGDVHAKTGSGNLNLRGIRGGLEATAGSGDILAEDIGGSAQAKTGSGQIKVHSVRGDVSTKAGSGDLEMRQAFGNVSAITGSGNIRLESAISEGGKWDVSTASGDVRFLLPSNSAFGLHARTSSGSLNIDFPLSSTEVQSKKEIRGVVSSPKADLSARTASGNIRISKM